MVITINNKILLNIYFSVLREILLIFFFLFGYSQFKMYYLNEWLLHPMLGRFKKRNLKMVEWQKTYYLRKLKSNATEERRVLRLTE